MALDKCSATNETTAAAILLLMPLWSASCIHTLVLIVQWNNPYLTTTCIVLYTPYRDPYTPYRDPYTLFETLIPLLDTFFGDPYTLKRAVEVTVLRAVLFIRWNQGSLVAVHSGRAATDRVLHSLLGLKK